MTEELSDTEKAELEALQLEITTQYTQKPEKDGLDTEDGNGNNAEGDVPKWMSFPVDPASGYRVDPETGDEYDAQTGVLIGSGETNLGNDVPINPNIE